MNGGKYMICDLCGNVTENKRAIGIYMLAARITYIECPECGCALSIKELRAAVRKYNQQFEETHYNHNHDSKGRFCSGSGAGESTENGVDKGRKSGIIDLAGDAMLKVSTGGRRNERNLTEAEIKDAIDYAVSLGMPVERIYYVDYDFTGYGASFDLLRIGTDVYPSEDHNNVPNSKISMHGAIAHEIIGHRNAALARRTQSNDILEEAQASIRAAKFTPDLSSSERITLYRDALVRLRNSNINLKDVKHTLYIFEE